MWHIVFCVLRCTRNVIVKRQYSPVQRDKYL